MLTPEDIFVEAEIAVMTDHLDRFLFPCPRAHFRNRIKVLQDRSKPQRRNPAYKVKPHPTPNSY